MYALTILKSNCRMHSLQVDGGALKLSKENCCCIPVMFFHDSEQKNILMEFIRELQFKFLVRMRPWSHTESAILRWIRYVTVFLLDVRTSKVRVERERRADVWFAPFHRCTEYIYYLKSRECSFPSITIYYNKYTTTYISMARSLRLYFILTSIF